MVCAVGRLNVRSANDVVSDAASIVSLKVAATESLEFLTTARIVPELVPTLLMCSLQLFSDLPIRTDDVLASSPYRVLPVLVSGPTASPG